MRTRLLVALSFLATAPLAAQVPGPVRVYPADPIFVAGQVLDKDALERRYPAPARRGGWSYNGGALVGPVTTDYSTVLFSTAREPRRYRGYLARVVTRGPRGGHDQVRIVAGGAIATLPGETEALDCTRRGGHVIVGLVNQRTRAVRALVARGNRVALERWTASRAEPCEVYDG